MCWSDYLFQAALLPSNNPPVCPSDSTKGNPKVSSQSSRHKSSSNNNKKLRLIIKSEFFVVVCCCWLQHSTCSLQYREIQYWLKKQPQTQQSATRDSSVATNDRSIRVTRPDTGRTVLPSVPRLDRRRHSYACISTHSCARLPTCKM